MNVSSFVSTIVFFFLLTITAHQAAAEEVGTVVRIKGSVLAVQDAIARPLKAGDTVLIGDYLSTGQDSRLEIQMIDDGRFMLGARTAFSVEDYTFGDGLNGNVILNLLSGVVDGVSGQIARIHPNGMHINTSAGNIGIRGTKFFVGEIEGDLHVTHWSGGGVHVKTHAGEVFMKDHHTGTVLRHLKLPPAEPKQWDAAQKEKAKSLVRH